jgi:N-dimethylarginine dimethylaminohydrolase
VVVGHTAIIARIGAQPRQGEEAAVATVLDQLGYKLQVGAGKWHAAGRWRLLAAELLWSEADVVLVCAVVWVGAQKWEAAWQPAAQHRTTWQARTDAYTTAVMHLAEDCAHAFQSASP